MVSALSTGLYSITVLDANGCTFSIPATTITEPTPLSLSTSQLDTGCNGAADGLHGNPNWSNPSITIYGIQEKQQQIFQL